MANKVPTRFLHNFLHWYATHHADLPFRFYIRQRLATGWYLGIHGIHPCIQIFLGKNALCVAVEWEGECWDLLLDLDIVPVRTSTGYQCALCEPLYKKLFRSKKALREHHYEDFALWLMGNLLPRQWLYLYRHQNGGTSASFEPDHKDSQSLTTAIEINIKLNT